MDNFNANVNRALRLLWYEGPAEAQRIMVASGLTASEAYLCIKAAMVLNRMRYGKTNG